MTTTQTATDTRQSIELDSKPGKAFLRRVIKGNIDGDEDWCLRADADSEWQIRFTRTIRGENGDPDVYVTVNTDSKVRPQRKSGPSRSFSDSDEVIIPLAKSLCLTSGTQTAVAAKMLLAGSTLDIEDSSGSTSSSKYGLAFLSLRATVPGCRWGSVTLDDSTFINGRQIIAGSIWI